jgi:hypothetical protein
VSGPSHSPTPPNSNPPSPPADSQDSPVITITSPMGPPSGASIKRTLPSPLSISSRLPLLHCRACAITA